MSGMNAEVCARCGVVHGPETCPKLRAVVEVPPCRWCGRSKSMCAGSNSCAEALAAAKEAAQQ